MEEKYQEKYQISNSHTFSQIFGSVVKYGSLMAGVYSMCKDEKDFAVATLAGFSYLCGDMMQVMSKKDHDRKNLSELEKSLKE